MSARPGDAHAFIAEVREGMERLNVYRGHTISLSAAPLQVGPGPVTLIQFESLPQVSRDAVVLPEGLLGRVERQTVTFSAHAAELLAAGRSLKRGLLLYGLPGTGKTLTCARPPCAPSKAARERSFAPSTCSKRSTN
jgi:hypothetical protein